MTATAYVQFYAKVYRPLVSAYHGRTIDAETIQNEQKVYAAELCEILAPFVRLHAATSLLDIGGSTGVVAHHLAKRFEIRATVLDPAPIELERAKQLGLETISGFMEEFNPGSGKFGLITMCQTVDHLVDIKTSLRKIHQMLLPSGLFYVDIVDFRAAFLRDWSVENAIKVDHPYYLTEPTIEAYLFRSGFEILRTTYASDHLHIGYVCQSSEPRLDYLPAPSIVNDLFQEVRKVQNVSTHRIQ